MATDIAIYLELMCSEGKIHGFNRDVNQGILGYSNGDVILLDEELLYHPVALFHEAGEGYFAKHPEEAAQLGQSPHSYLRGLGSKSDNKIMSPAGYIFGEKPGGLQDKVFGKEQNHLELKFKNSKDSDITAIAFFKTAEKFEVPVAEGNSINLVATLEKSQFRNFPELRLRIVDIF